MTMSINIWYICTPCAFLILLSFFHTLVASSSSLSLEKKVDLYIEPASTSVSSGENVTFTCASPSNISFIWRFEEGNRPFPLTTENSSLRFNNHTHFWSTVVLPYVKRAVAKKILCFGDGKKVSASLLVNGVGIGGICRDSDDCLTDRSQCLTEVCTCPMNHVLLRLKRNGHEVCRERIYKLYDPCEFSEQCFLVKSHSICGPNGICTCASWATDVNGECVSKNELSYSRSQEMYRVGLITVTCVIIIIIAVSLWITLRRSCHEQISITPRRSVANIRNIENPRLSTSTIFEITTDKPPSYDELVDPGDIVTSSPPDIKDALKHSMTAKKLIRQVSAPAGHLLTKTSSLDISESPKTGYVSPVFKNDG